MFEYIDAMNTLPIETINHIYSLQQLSYTVEKQLLTIDLFPPLLETEEELAKSNDACILKVIDENIVGLLQYDVTKNNVVINKLVVHPDYFRQGIGSDLLHALIKHQPNKSIQVETARENTPAMTLYQKHGLTHITPLAVVEGLHLVRLEKY